MIEILFKYFSTIWCGFYSYSRLTNNKLKLKQVVLYSPIIAINTILSYYLRITVPPLNILLIYVTILILVLLDNKRYSNYVVTISTISIGLSFVLYTIAMLLILPFAYLLFNSINNINVLGILIALIISVLQIIFSILLFKIKRFKNGIIDLSDKFNTNVGLIISLITLFIICILYTSEFSYAIGYSIFFLLILCGFLLYFYFKKLITNRYISKVQKRNTEILENELSEQNQAVANLSTQNEELSKIIHRDNKLIPAMLLAVEEILNCQSPDEQKEKSCALLPQLKTMAEERTGILNKYEKDNKQLPTTGFISLDSSLKYLLNKAKEKDISLDLSVTTSIKYLSSVIDENDLNTLILDLVENAVIAISTADIRNILIIIGTENENLCISIYDSGDHFNPRVIANLGIKRITTHKKTGGSGIGMMTTFDILKKYQGSFIINERIENKSYTKEIKLLFDKQNETRILTDREEIKNIISKRKDIISN